MLILYPRLHTVDIAVAATLAVAYDADDDDINDSFQFGGDDGCNLFFLISSFFFLLKNKNMEKNDESRKNTKLYVA